MYRRAGASGNSLKKRFAESGRQILGNNPSFSLAKYQSEESGYVVMRPTLGSPIFPQE